VVSDYSSGSLAALRGCATGLLEPALRGAKSRRLATMTGIAEKSARLGAPALRRLAVADANEVAVRSGGWLIDAADARRQAAA